MKMNGTHAVKKFSPNNKENTPNTATNYNENQEVGLCKGVTKTGTSIDVRNDTGQCS